MKRAFILVFALTLTGASVLAQDQRRVLTAADYDRATRMLAPALNGLVVGGTVAPNWLPDGRFWYVRTTLAGTENVVVDPARGTREVVATPPAGAAPGQTAGAGRGGRGGRGGGAGVQITRDCGVNVTGLSTPPVASMSPDRSK